VEGIEVDVFDWGEAAVMAIELAPPLGLADVDPVGSTVTSASEVTAFNEGLQQNRLMVLDRMIHVAQPPPAEFADSRFSGHSRRRPCPIFRRKASHE